ncbi:MAG TPA: CsbD family protein [Candidatus Thermoplasmatota archaeon]|nr:CsbD family protein [Candidatus Thermoplasmatota archaeon]
MAERTPTSTEQKWQGRWDQLKGRVRETWGDLTDDEIDSHRGNWQQFTGWLSEKTGETRETIERRFDEWTRDTDTTARRGDRDLERRPGTGF